MNPATATPDVFARLAEVSDRLSATYAELAKLLSQHEALLAESGWLSRPSRSAAGGVSRLLAIVAAHYEVPVERILGPDRVTSVVVPRQVVMWLLKELSGMSRADIARVMGRRDPGTTMHAWKTVSGYRDINGAFRRETDALKDQVRGLFIGVAPTTFSAARLRQKEIA